MSQNLYDTANQLEREFRQSQEYQELMQAFEGIDKNEESKALFAEFSALTMKFHELQATGQMPSEEELAEVQAISEKAQANPEIQALIKAEQAISILMEDLNRIITRPLAEIYRARQEQA